MEVYHFTHSNAAAFFFFKTYEEILQGSATKKPGDFHQALLTIMRGMMRETWFVQGMGRSRTHQNSRGWDLALIRLISAEDRQRAT